MTEKILGIGDPHLKNKNDIGDNFEQKIYQTVQDKDIDHIVVPGDVIDNLPNERQEHDTIVGQEFFKALNESGVPVLAVGGNHDHDIHPDITEGYENVVNLNYNKFETSRDDTDYTFIGRGAIEFDQGPEIPIDLLNKYDENTGYGKTRENQIEDDLTFIDDDMWYSDLEEYFEIENEDRPQFRDGIDFYLEEYNKVSELFENAEGDQIIYINHNVPFNTDVDKNLSGEHIGSLVDKQIIREYQPELNISGHLHDGGLDYIDHGYGTTTTLVNLGKRQLVETELNGHNGANYLPLNKPDL